MLTLPLEAGTIFMGFPKGALASPLVKGGVKTLTAKWLGLFVLHGPTALSRFNIGDGKAGEPCKSGQLCST